MHISVGLTGIAMVAFAANSLLCRMALANTTIDPGLFTAIRLISGAVCLLTLVFMSNKNWLRPSFALQNIARQTSVVGAICLFVYALGFSYAYISMSTGTGALLLFGAVQITMITRGLLSGERFRLLQWIGFLLAFTGLVILLLPGASAPPVISAVLMISAGIAWGVYSLIGKKSTAPLLLSTGNFVLASVLIIPLIVWLALTSTWQWNTQGALYGLASGMLASGLGYAIWYKALPLLHSTTAATVQLSVPVIATAMGWMFLGEVIGLQIIIASIMSLGGIWLVIAKRA